MEQATRLGLYEAGDVIVDPAVFDALIDDVYLATAPLVDEPPIAVELDLVALGQDRIQLPGEDLVVEVVLVVGAGGEDGER